jgi:hypothetical protein
MSRLLKMNQEQLKDKIVCLIDEAYKVGKQFGLSVLSKTETDLKIEMINKQAELLSYQISELIKDKI